MCWVGWAADVTVLSLWSVFRRITSDMWTLLSVTKGSLPFDLKLAFFNVPERSKRRYFKALLEVFI